MLFRIDFGDLKQMRFSLFKIKKNENRKQKKKFFFLFSSSCCSIFIFSYSQKSVVIVIILKISRSQMFRVLLCLFPVDVLLNKFCFLSKKRFVQVKKKFVKNRDSKKIFEAQKTERDEPFSRAQSITFESFLLLFVFVEL